MDPLVILGIILILAALGVYLWVDHRQTTRLNELEYQIYPERPRRRY